MSQPVPAAGPTTVVSSESPADTLALGRRLAGLLRPGDVVLLAGRLGVGKTLLAAGIAEGLGVQEQVTSPTFVLVRSYDGFMPVHHVDVYRLSSTGEFDDLDLFADAGDGVILIEWGNAVAAAVPPDHLLVEISVSGEDQRLVAMTPHGSWCGRALGGMVA